MVHDLISSVRGRSSKTSSRVSLSSRRSMVWCPLLCPRRILKILNTSDLSKRKPPVMDACLPHESIRAVISLDSNMSRTVDPQGSVKMALKQLYTSVLFPAGCVSVWNYLTHISMAHQFHHVVLCLCGHLRKGNHKRN